MTNAQGRFTIPLGVQQATRTADVADPVAVEGCRVQVRIPGFEEILVPVKRPEKISGLTVGDLTLKQVNPQASAAFSAAGRSAPPKARSIFIRAFEAINTRKYSEAMSALDKALIVYPQYASALQSSN